MKRVVFGLIVLVFAERVFPDAPVLPLTDFQGVLTNASGKALMGQKRPQFRIRDSAGPAGNVVCGLQTMYPVPVVNGQFNVIKSKADNNGPAVTSVFKRGAAYDWDGLIFGVALQDGC